jgi:ABC-2 type transport system permease protein
MTALAQPVTPSLRALAAFVELELRRVARNRRYLFFGVGFPTVFYLLYTGVLSGAAAKADAPIDGTTWGAYFMVSMATYGAIVAALGGASAIAQDRASGWTRQLHVTPLRPFVYVVGKLFVSYLVTVPAIGAVLIAASAVNQVSLPPGAWLEVLLVLAIGALPFAAFGILIGYVFGPDGAQGATILSFLSLAVLGGLWAPISTFPDTVATIGRMLPSYDLAEVGRDAVVGAPPDAGHLLALGAYAVVISGLVAWRYREAEQRPGG